VCAVLGSFIILICCSKVNSEDEISGKRKSTPLPDEPPSKRPRIETLSPTPQPTPRSLNDNTHTREASKDLEDMDIEELDFDHCRIYATPDFEETPEPPDAAREQNIPSPCLTASNPDHQEVMDDTQKYEDPKQLLSDQCRETSPTDNEAAMDIDSNFNANSNHALEGHNPVSEDHCLPLNSRDNTPPPQPTPNPNSQSGLAPDSNGNSLDNTPLLHPTPDPNPESETASDSNAGKQHDKPTVPSEESSIDHTTSENSVDHSHHEPFDENGMDIPLNQSPIEDAMANGPTHGTNECFPCDEQHPEDEINLSGPCDEDTQKEKGVDLSGSTSRSNENESESGEGKLSDEEPGSSHRGCESSDSDDEHEPSNKELSHPECESSSSESEHGSSNSDSESEHESSDNESEHESSEQEPGSDEEHESGNEEREYRNEEAGSAVQEPDPSDGGPESAGEPESDEETHKHSMDDSDASDRDASKVDGSNDEETQENDDSSSAYEENPESEEGNHSDEVTREDVDESMDEENHSDSDNNSHGENGVRRSGRNHGKAPSKLPITITGSSGDNSSGSTKKSRRRKKNKKSRNNYSDSDTDSEPEIKAVFTKDPLSSDPPPLVIHSDFEIQFSSPSPKPNGSLDWKEETIVLPGYEVLVNISSKLK
jgi:hypothetical protein